jgi:hypothetical protein
MAQDKFGHDIEKGDVVGFVWNGEPCLMKVTDMVDHPSMKVPSVVGQIEVVVPAASTDVVKKAEAPKKAPEKPAAKPAPEKPAPTSKGEK